MALIYDCQVHSLFRLFNLVIFSSFQLNILDQVFNGLINIKYNKSLYHSINKVDFYSFGVI